jgi:hypothetical protein
MAGSATFACAIFPALGSRRASALALPAIAAIALRLREGDGTAADKAVRIKAAMALLDEGKGVSVNVQVNNQTKNTTAIRPDYVLDLSARYRQRGDAPTSRTLDVERARLTASPNDPFTAR